MDIGHDNLEDFADPVHYDLEEFPRSPARIGFYARLAAEVGGPALELACGSGIVAIAVAQRGIELVGVDLCAPILAHAGRKADALGLHITWRHGDMRSVELARRFRFVCLSGNAFQAMLTDDDQRALLATVRRHLAPNGVFAFETRHPPGHDLSDRNDEELWGHFTRVDGHRVTVSGTQRWDAAAGVLHWTTWRRWHAAPPWRLGRLGARTAQ